MSLARVQFFSVSLDGFGSGEGQSLDTPFGHAGERLHEWMFVTSWWHEVVGQPGGSRGIEDAFLRLHDRGIGAEIMGARKFGPPGWHENPEWNGWWGPNPPFHTPTFVLTHHPRPPIEMEGGRRHPEQAASLGQAHPVGVAGRRASHQTYSNLSERCRLAHCTISDARSSARRDVPPASEPRRARAGSGATSMRCSCRCQRPRPRPVEPLMTGSRPWSPPAPRSRAGRRSRSGA